MIDNELIALLIRTMRMGLEEQGYAPDSFNVVQKWQPTQQGVLSTPTAYIEKLFDKAYGFPMRKQTYRPATDDFETSTIQNMETTVQMSAWVTQNPASPQLPTASDMANDLRLWFCLPEARAAMMKSYSANVLRVTDVTNAYVEDDRDRGAATPSFDLIVTHHRRIDISVPKVSFAEVNVYPVL